VEILDATLEKLAFGRIRAALADRCASHHGIERVEALAPTPPRAEIERQLDRVEEVVEGGDLSLGGVHDVRPLLGRVREGLMLDGRDLLEVAYTMEAAGDIRRAIVASERPALIELASGLSSFDGVLRLVREQLDAEGNVRDDATPKLRDIRRRLLPLRGRIRERLQGLLERYSDFVQDPIITLRRDRYVIPIQASFQSRVPGIALDASDSGATVFLEPQAVVPMNHELALLQFEERDEVRRILIALGQRLAFEPGLDDTLEILADLDVVNASARLAEDWSLTRPVFDDDSTVQLLGARHPLIEGCVPNDLNLSPEQRLLVVTGPNAGGKTVLIKTLGLAALMAQSGLFVAADPAVVPQLPFFDGLYVDIGDEQSIEASLSTYAGHLTNLKRIVDRAGEGALVLIDELGSGTDPSEGAALSQAILESVLAGGALGLITTHLAPLKVFATETAGARNAAMRFDVERLAPSYQLVVGQPGRSYALAIAERLGLGDALLGRAAEILGPEGERLERLLETLEEQRERLAEELAEAERARDEALSEAELLREQIERLRTKEAEVMAAAAERAEGMLQDTLQRAKELRSTATHDPEHRSQALEEIQQLRRDAKERSGRAPKAPEPAEEDPLRPGTVVRVESYGAEGPIQSWRGDRAVVQLGLLKVEVERDDLRPIAQPKPSGPEAPPAAPAAGRDIELNIRGERVEQGLELVRDFVLEAHALKREKVRILHGKGTGTLRDAVRSYLRNEKRVERYEDAVPYEGGHGVTVAYIRQPG
jgi:DNA mismatch repair protein MutS2